MRTMTKILIIDDNAEDQLTYERYLLKEFSSNVKIFKKDKCEEAFLFLSDNAIDCILLDYHLPDMDGIEFLKRLRGSSMDHSPVIMLTGQGNEKIAVDALKSGATDYLVKGEFKSDILHKAILGAIEKNQLKAQIEEKEIEIEHIAYYDHLTDIPNRLYFEEALARALSFAKRNKKNIAVMFIDLDGFKDVNDTLGHNAGDALLKEVVKRYRMVLREEDLLARIGGDEFGILISHLETLNEMDCVAQKLIDSLKPSFLLSNESVSVGCSIGIAIYPMAGETAVELMKNSDISMYDVKKEGKNAYRFYNKANYS